MPRRLVLRHPFHFPTILLLILVIQIIFANKAFTAPSPPAGVLGVVAVGDIMMGTAWPEGVLPPDDGRDIFQHMGEALGDRDIVFGNLEGPLVDNGVAGKCDHARNPKLCFAFRTPTRYVRYLEKAGFNALNIANNHAFDFGREGIDNTLATLSAAGIQAVGGTHIARFTVGGKRVVILGFSYSRPTPHSTSILDIPTASALIRKHESENDLVLVSFHGGAEGKDALHLTGGMEIFAGEKRGDVETFAHAAIDAGASAVFGHGPHVPRAIEIYRDRLIAYSLGNFLTYGMFNLKGTSGIGYALRADLDLESGRFLSGKIVATELKHRGIPEPDPEGRTITLIRQLTRDDLKSRGAIIRADGTILPPPGN